MRTIAYCGDHTALTTTKYGDKIYVDTRDTSLAPHLMIEGDWEPWVAKRFVSELAARRESTVIDVGANFGWYTLLACRFGRHPVIALEPHPRLAKLLQKTLRVNGYGPLVTLFDEAAGSARGVQRMSYTDDELGGSTLERLDDMNRIVFYEDVRVDKLDHIAGAAYAMHKPTLSLDRAIIKIDVEGREADVLAGALDLLSKGPVLFLEHHVALSVHYVGLLGRTHTIQEIRHDSHLGPELDVDGLRAVGEAETLLCLPREG